MHENVGNISRTWKLTRRDSLQQDNIESHEASLILTEDGICREWLKELINFFLTQLPRAVSGQQPFSGLLMAQAVIQEKLPHHSVPRNKSGTGQGIHIWVGKKKKNKPDIPGIRQKLPRE